MALTSDAYVSVSVFEPQDILTIYCDICQKVIINCNKFKFIIKQDICFR